MPAESPIRRILARLGLRPSETSKPHPHESGHESQEPPLGRRARARERDPGYEHHQHGKPQR